jgi:hypothetical protein
MAGYNRKTLSQNDGCCVMMLDDSEQAGDQVDNEICKLIGHRPRGYYVRKLFEESQDEMKKIVVFSTQR